MAIIQPAGHLPRHRKKTGAKEEEAAEEDPRPTDDLDNPDPTVDAEQQIDDPEA